jgi:hypothetical protein
MTASVIGPSRPESEFLLGCLRPEAPDEIVLRVHELAGNGLDWEAVLRRARIHKIAPMVYRGLKAMHVRSVPQRVLEALQADFHDSMRHNLYLTRELLGLIDLFQRNQLPVIPYKGPALAAALYQNLALRPFGDLDILVHPQDAQRARQLLISQGYRLGWPEKPLTPRQERLHLDTKYNYKFDRADGRVIIELHWSITPHYINFPPDPEWLWQDLQPLALGGCGVSHFSPERLLLVLCVHGSNHVWNRLMWVCDLAYLLQVYPDLNWSFVLAEAARFGVERMLLLSLEIARRLLGVELPEAVLARIEKDPQARRMAAYSAAPYLTAPGRVPGSFEVPVYLLQARERLSDRLRYLLFLTTPSVKDWEEHPLPDSLSFLYYFLRPVRLLAEHGLEPLRQRSQQRK